MKASGHLTFSLPVAPTANNAFINRKGGRGYGRIKSRAYRNWLKQADAWYVLQGLGQMPPIIGAYTCQMAFPKIIRGDLDGRIKLLLDWLVSRKLVEDDSPQFLRKITASFSGEPGNLVWITVKQDGGTQHDATKAQAQRPRQRLVRDATGGNQGSAQG